jgi:hypothetical protein
MSERIPPKDYDPTTALEALAHESEPPSRLDVLRAAHDGYRLRVRRRLIRMLSGVTAAGAIAAVAVLVPLHANGAATGPADRGTTPSATPTSNAAGDAPPISIRMPDSGVCTPLVGVAAPPPGTDFTMQVPAEFGWLPGNVLPYVDQGPVDFNGVFDLGGDGVPGDNSAYSALAGSLDQTGPQIKLYLYENAFGVPGLDVPPPGCNGMFGDQTLLNSVYGSAFSGTPYLRSGPRIGGRPSYWISLDPNSDFVGSSALFAFETAEGHWAVLQATDLDSATMVATLEHVATTVTVGDLDLPSPIQISGIPKSLGMQMSQSTTDTPTAGSAQTTAGADIGVSFGNNADYVWLAAFPVAQFPKWADGSVCETSNGLKIRADDAQGAISRYVPGGLNYLLAHVVSLGPNRANWSPNVVINTK